MIDKAKLIAHQEKFANLQELKEHWHLSSFRRNLFQQTAPELARQLLGSILLVRTEFGYCGGRIVETEAYHESEPASHCFRGLTERNQYMFEAGGRVYVYRIYGIHVCFNIVSGLKGSGEAVLIRAIEPYWGLSYMRQRRTHSKVRMLCNGPAKLCQALGISMSHNGILVDSSSDIRLLCSPLMHLEHQGEEKIACSPRIGISQAKDLLWRFYIAHNPFVSGSAAFNRRYVPGYQ